MPNVVVYCTQTCPYCVKALQLLEKKGVEVECLRVDQTPSLWDEIRERTGRSTVPQIFIDDYHVGGFDDMIELDLDGELDPLLKIKQ